METVAIQDDWKILTQFLPEGWEQKAYELRAFVRKRNLDDPEQLLRLLLIHLADGKSLRTASAYAEETGLCSINDVAILKRLRSSAQWLHWMAVELFKELKGYSIPDKLHERYNIKAVDASVICEPGSTGTDWRLHYCFKIDSFHCDFLEVTSPHVAEKFQMFPVEKNDLLLGDRLYCHRNGISYVLSHGGDVLVRFHSTSLPLYKRNGTRFNVIQHLRVLEGAEVGDWDVWFKSPVDEKLIKGRICALRKSKEAAERDKKKIIKNAAKKQRTLLAETLDYAEYITIFTTVNRHNFTREDLLTLYRGRWQIELVFKRLKSIIGVGHLPNSQAESCVGWLYGKLLLAMLVERFYQEAEFFSPWGYPIRIHSGD